MEVTELGVRFEVLRLGNGSAPTKSSTVTVHYIGTDINGEEFYNSYERGSPPAYKVTELTQGLILGSQKMNVGAIFRFYLPGELGNVKGDTHSRSIAPGSALIYDIELLKIE